MGNGDDDDADDDDDDDSELPSGGWAIPVGSITAPALTHSTQKTNCRHHHQHQRSTITISILLIIIVPLL